MTRKPFIGGNWKMNNTISEAVVLAQDICNRYEKDWPEQVDVAVFPPYLAIKPVKTVFDFDRVRFAVGAQNTYWEASGAYTGELSPRMLQEAGCTYCIIGHSERRQLFGETNEDVNRKVEALVQAGIMPVICVGESLAIREAGRHGAYVCSQVKAGLAGLSSQALEGCVIAYEPVWAIGTGRTATPQQAQEVCAAIRAGLADMFDSAFAEQTRIIYGGSMNEGNAALLMREPDIDGGLIGTAALSAHSFINLVSIAAQSSEG